MSNRYANSASVISPLIAASAPFALKAGLCVRRIRFVMSAPDPRQPHRCQARNPPIELSEFPKPSLDLAVETFEAIYLETADTTADATAA
jgi:hypothetical protein